MPSLKPLFFVSFGGILGTLLRYGLSLWIPNDRTGTFAANVIGVALAAHLLVVMERRGITEVRLFLLPGFCAGLTTFSAVTVHALEPNISFSYLALNVVTSLVLVILVLPLSRKLVPVRK